MIPWSLVATSSVPGGAGEIRLLRRGAEFSIVLGAVELMNSRRGGSEEALATRTCQRRDGRAAPSTLSGGLGMGFTLRAARAGLGPRARVTVAELVPAVLDWARGPLADVFAESLHDPRVAIVVSDVGQLIRSADAAYDAIMLDVDNGPAGQPRASNDGLYGAAGLAAARRALREGGVLAVWSVEPNAAFARRMRSAGLDVEEIRARANGGRGSRHVIWLGRRR